MTCLLMLRKDACAKGLVVLEKDHGAGYTMTNLKLCPYKLQEVVCKQHNCVPVEHRLGIKGYCEDC